MWSEDKRRRGELMGKNGFACLVRHFISTSFPWGQVSTSCQLWHPCDLHRDCTPNHAGSEGQMRIRHPELFLLSDPLGSETAAASNLRRTHVLVPPLFSCIVPEREDWLGVYSQCLSASHLPALGKEHTNRWTANTSRGMKMGQTGFCFHCLDLLNPPSLTASISSALQVTVSVKNKGEDCEDEYSGSCWMLHGICVWLGRALSLFPSTFHKEEWQWAGWWNTSISSILLDIQSPLQDVRQGLSLQHLEAGYPLTPTPPVELMTLELS